MTSDNFGQGLLDRHMTTRKESKPQVKTSSRGWRQDPVGRQAIVTQREQDIKTLKDSLMLKDQPREVTMLFRLPELTIRIINRVNAQEHVGFEICRVCKVRVYEIKQKLDEEHIPNGLDICNKSMDGLHVLDIK